MDLDIDTLFIVNLFTATIVSLVMLIIWRMQRASACLGWLSLAAFCLVIGSLLVPARDLLPDFLSTMIAHSIYLLWAIFIWRGIRNFQGLAFPLKNVALSVFAFACLLLYYSYFAVNNALLLMVSSLFVTAYSILSIIDLLKPVHNHSPAIEHKFLVAIITVFNLFILLRLALVLFAEPEYIQLDTARLEQVSILAFMLYSVAFALGFLWVLQRHLENQSEQRAEALKVANALTEQLRKEAEKAALHDPLTRAGNRRKFESNANLERQRHLRHNHELCLAFVDIDYFKAVNDKLGHDRGDQVLKLLVTYFMDIIRNIDMVYRWGGEEFIILLPETSLAKAILVCERIRKHTQSHLLVEQEQITISIGVTQLRGRESINRLVKRADKLLYEAKQKGRNCVVGR